MSIICSHQENLIMVTSFHQFAHSSIQKYGKGYSETDYTFGRRRNFLRARGEDQPRSLYRMWWLALAKNMVTWITILHRSSLAGRRLQYFNTFLFKIGKVPHHGYSHSDKQGNTAKHIVFDYISWEKKWDEVIRQVRNTTIDNLVARMLQNPGIWNNIDDFIKYTYYKKKRGSCIYSPS